MSDQAPSGVTPLAPAANPWRDRVAPGLADLEELAAAAFARLPESFRALCADVVIAVEDFPTDEVLDAMQLDSEFDLLGLFQGIGRAQGGALAQTGQMPNMVFLYRRPILDYWAEHEETLGDLVSHVLVHEIGHHFGLSDADMEALEAEAD
ncbi:MULTISPECIES: metallopeptidase family protein [unclassified Xanthobacter]|uniref:metallopeptidase family protein n=1 Tax=unclassified Xanthobacter TaxID=2623496 RepID=UPI001EDDF3FA|nr:MULTISPECIES: metallopeptidase family protein [unclassified Xanthobacter]